MFKNDFSSEIWQMTYKDASDMTVNDNWKRVASAIASVEQPENVHKYEELFYELLSDFKFVPGGRILANAGTQWKGTTFINCFVKDRNKYDIDSLKGILSVLADQAQTLKSEGGWGCNFSFIRPRGSFIHGIGVESPGAVKYMELFDKSSEIITSGSGKKSTNKRAKGKIRKGAMMGMLDCFSKDTEILTNKGYQSLDKICNERDPHLKAITENAEEYPIIDWIINPPSQLYEVEDSEGNKVKVTAEHEFVVYNEKTGEEYLKKLCEIDPDYELLVRIEEVR